METLGKFAVVGATSLAGGQHRFVSSNDTCAAGCAQLNALVSTPALLAPWIVSGALVACLSVPTVVLESRQPELGLQILFSFYSRLISLLLTSATLVPAASYTLSLHASVYGLLTLPYRPCLLGGPLWWGLRYVGATGLVVFAAYLGPPVPLVAWPGLQSVECAACAHLLGALLPDLIRFSQSAVVAAVAPLLRQPRCWQ